MNKLCVYGLLALLLVGFVSASASSVLLEDGKVYSSATYEPFNLGKWLSSIFGTSFSVVGASGITSGTSAEFTFVIDSGACAGKTDVGVATDGYSYDNVASSVSLKNSQGYYYVKKSFTFYPTVNGVKESNQEVCGKVRCSASGGVYYSIGCADALVFVKNVCLPNSNDLCKEAVFNSGNYGYCNIDSIVSCPDGCSDGACVSAPVKTCADYGYLTSIPSGKTCTKIYPLYVSGYCYKDCVVITKTCADYGYLSAVPSGKTCTKMSLSDVNGYCYRDCVTASVKSCSDYGLYDSEQSGMSCSLTSVTGTSLSCYVCEEIPKTCADYGLYPSSQSGMSCTADNSKGISCYSCESLMPTCEDYGLYASEQSGMGCVADSTNGLSCYDCSVADKTCEDYGLKSNIPTSNPDNCFYDTSKGITCYDCSGNQSCSGITLGGNCLEGQKLGIAIGVAVVVLFVVSTIIIYLRKNKPRKGKRRRR